MRAELKAELIVALMNMFPRAYDPVEIDSCSCIDFSSEITDKLPYMLARCFGKIDSFYSSTELRFVWTSGVM